MLCTLVDYQKNKGENDDFSLYLEGRIHTYLEILDFIFGGEHSISEEGNRLLICTEEEMVFEIDCKKGEYRDYEC